jgi:hypothetical protein
VPAQSAPPTPPPIALNPPRAETAGVQSASLGSDRTSIMVQIIEPLKQIMPAINAILPSTGGPSTPLVALVLFGLGGVGVGLRRVGLRRRP